jgi:hypothetical protein
MLAQTISAPAISFFIFTPIPLTLCGITAAPIAEDQARKCELAHTSARLSKKQRLTELCWKRDATGGCGGLAPHLLRAPEDWNAPRYARAGLNQNNFETDQMKTVVIWNFLGVLMFFALIILMWAALGLTSA